ncbi:glycoside hydrolase [Hysterangium stoloniferum]|nr:glycoside hydrolase [Hysterangium stoloniferum]
MPRVPSISPATGTSTPDYYIHTTCSNFVDSHGRTLLLRGVNLSGSSKTPAGSQTQVLENFWEDAEAGGKQFIGRPLNLEDGSADVHLARLKAWGFNMLRYVVTWEALEHEGPGKYDFEFMDYTVRVLRKCAEYGFKVFIDPHQDIWSRFTGGSGAPYWTLIACGINPRHMTATQSAIVHCEYPTAQFPDPASLPAMLWSTNYGRLAAQTVFTLFFAGRDFAPKCVIDGVNIQDYLEHHFFTAFGHLADRIRDAGDLLDACVIGWDSINEPFEGFCGNPDLANAETTHNATLKKGTQPAIIQSLRLGMGQKQTLENWKFTAIGPRRDGDVIVDPKGRKIWLDPDVEKDGLNTRWGWTRGPEWKLGTCVWAQHGVWDVHASEFTNPFYFASSPARPNEPVSFVETYWKAHWRKYVQRIRQSHPEAIHFVQPPVFVEPPPLDEKDDLRGRACYSGHYYDGLTLVTRHWNWFNADALGILRGKYKWMLQGIRIGEPAIRKCIQEQLGILKKDTELIGAYPTLIGEIGTPFDMDGKRSYGYTDNGKHTGDFRNQQKALDASLNAADGPNCINWTVWTYCPDHTHAFGDGWNMEDLSLWSPDDLGQWRIMAMAMVRAPAQAALRLRLPRGRERNVPSASSSAATLLRPELRSPFSFARPGKNMAAVAAAGKKSTSTLSLATLGPAREGEAAAPTSLSAWDNPLDFVLDGGRAVPAFSRPYPVATVGVPVHMEFDIKKARFTLTVRVTPEDGLMKPQRERRCEDGHEDTHYLDHADADAHHDHGHAAQGLGEWKDPPDVMPTEIFLPLVHYASQSLVARSMMQHRGVGADGDYDGQDQDLGSNTPTDPDIDDIDFESPVSSYISATSTLALAARSSLDVHVEVSHGRTEVEGQYLKWWYDVPARGEVEYSVTITRLGGPIKFGEGEGGGDGDGTVGRGLLRRLRGVVCSRIVSFVSPAFLHQ